MTCYILSFFFCMYINSELSEEKNASNVPVYPTEASQTIDEDDHQYAAKIVLFYIRNHN